VLEVIAEYLDLDTYKAIGVPADATICQSGNWHLTALKTPATVFSVEDGRVGPRNATSGVVSSSFRHAAALC